MNHKDIWAKGALLALIFIFAPLISGCDLFGSDKSDDALSAQGVIVVNGGNFGDQNGNLTTYDPDTEEVVQGPSLNGFAQGLIVHGDRAYALINTFSTGHVEILDAESLAPIGRMDLLPAPRSMVIHDGIAYVTNFIFGSPGQVIPIPLATGQAGTPVEMGSVLEGITEIDGRIFVAEYGNLGDGTEILTFEAGATDFSAVDVGCDGPHDLFPNASGDLIILCSGKTVYNDDFSEIIAQTGGAVLLFDPVELEVIARVSLVTQLGATNGTAAGYLVPGTDILYATAGDANLVYRIDLAARVIDLILSIPPEDGLIGLSGIAYDSGSELLYVGRFPRSSAGDFPDYTSSGTVLAINSFGEIETSFQVGPAPSQIVLRDRVDE